MQLAGKRVIVTGAAQGLGRAFCLHLASHGARILAADIQADRAEETASLARESGGEAVALRVDVTSEQDTRHMATRTFETWGGIDALVNNAAIYAGIIRRAFDQIPLDEWDRVMRVNVRGPWLCARAVAPYMRNQRSGAIVNIASEVAFSGSHLLTHYVASKAAVVGLTRALARELGQWNIRVNALAPGFTDTEASRQLADVTKYDTSLTPLGRLGRPEDLLGALALLISDASAFVTGQTLLVNGGRVVH
jgi:NAD(P)-dependent dehydrogenase (short-subunit alcohol dehydrogenase family)